MAIAQIVIASIVSVFRVTDGSKITEVTTAADVDGWDSLSHTMLLMKLEDALGRQLPVAAMYSAANVGQLIDLVATAVPATGRSEQKG
jgi:acyl carrier protein